MEILLFALLFTSDALYRYTPKGETLGQKAKIKVTFFPRTLLLLIQTQINIYLWVVVFEIWQMKMLLSLNKEYWLAECPQLLKCSPVHLIHSATLMRPVLLIITFIMTIIKLYFPDKESKTERRFVLDCALSINDRAEI